MTLNIPYEQFDHTMLRFVHSSQKNKSKDAVKEVNKDYYRVLYSTSHTTITGVSIIIEPNTPEVPYVQNTSHIVASIKNIESNIYQQFLRYMVHFHQLPKEYNRILHKTNIADTVATMLTNTSSCIIIRINGIHWIHSHAQPVLHYYISTTSG